MVQWARAAHLVDLFYLALFTGFRRNSHGEVAPSGNGRLAGIREILLLAVPGSRVSNRILCGGKLPDEPKDHEGVGPIYNHWGTNDRHLPKALRAPAPRSCLVSRLVTSMLHRAADRAHLCVSDWGSSDFISASARSSDAAALIRAAMLPVGSPVRSIVQTAPSLPRW